MKGNILRAGLVLITIVTVCIITDFSTIMVLIGATCCSLLGKCLITTSPAIQVAKFPRTADQPALVRGSLLILALFKIVFI